MSSILTMHKARTIFRAVAWPLTGALVIAAVSMIRPPLASSVRQMSRGIQMIGPIAGEQKLLQVFTAADASLGGVGVVLGTAPLASSDEVRISILKLEDGKRGREIAFARLRARDFGDQSLTVVRFDPISLTPGRPYAFELQIDSEQGAYAAISEEDAYDGGDLYLGGSKINGDAQFRVYKAPGTSWLEDLTGGAYKALASSSLIKLALIAYAALLGMLVGETIRVAARREPNL